MTILLCRTCGQLPNITIPSNPTATPFQQVKTIKHTSPTANYPINSRFDDPNDHAMYLTSGINHGVLSIDALGRTALVFDAGRRVGTTSAPGFHRVESAVTVLCWENPLRVHAHPTAADLIRVGHCVKCGSALP